MSFFIRLNLLWLRVFYYNALAEHHKIHFTNYCSRHLPLIWCEDKTHFNSHGWSTAAWVSCTRQPAKIINRCVCKNWRVFWWKTFAQFLNDSTKQMNKSFSSSWLSAHARPIKTKNMKRHGKICHPLSLLKPENHSAELPEFQRFFFLKLIEKQKKQKLINAKVMQSVKQRVEGK